MSSNKIQEQTLKEYKKRSEAILQRMRQIIIRIQRKIDDEAYRNALKKIEQEGMEKGDQ